ncbi:asparagine synthase-related protein [Telmatospirillum sp.]|uniref:asparagine synthase-related protein n=1 Tax=Telmatospirillum sp. TaxID=2079197 RepID=UPI00284784EE|nr:asparagine synthase-related protein [Telmatospirillum sp.]MDR3438115.1 asparagine synthase-related protein [Telmatospirillum sp.]
MRTTYLLAIAPAAGALRVEEPRIAARAAELGLTLEARSAGTLLFIGDPRIIAAKRVGRIYLGQCFEGSRALGADEMRRNPLLWAPDTAISRIFQTIWGGFILLDFGEDGSVTIARDPGGRLPCYVMTACDGWRYLASDATVLFAVSGERPRLDPAALAHHLARPQLRTARTCLALLDELPAGTSRCWGPAGTAERRHWSPWDHADPSRAFTDADTAAEALRDTVLASTRALSAHHRQLVHALSGGLDSSIVAVGLAAARAPVAAINLATEDALGDEKHYAQMVADHLGVALVLASEDPALVDLWHSDAADLPRPAAKAYTQSADRRQSRLAEELGADAFVSGGGGDQVFAYMHSCTPLLDYIAIEGWNRGALTVAHEIARMTGCGLPALSATSLRRMARRDARYTWRADTRGLSHWAASLIFRQPAHPWGDPPKGIPPGKAMHVAWLQHIENHLEGYGRERDRPIIWPLMAQPVVECCLAIPSWMWCAGGRNRAVARRAFHRDLPPQIIDRISKGSPESVMITTFETHRESVLDVVCNGVLAELGLVDGEALRSLARPPDVITSTELGRIMTLLDVEVWARHWHA